MSGTSLRRQPGRHQGGGDKSGEGLPLPLEIKYDVLEEAPILLTSHLGSEYWQLCHFGAETMTAVYTDEKTDLSQRGTQTAKATKARFGKSYGPFPGSGLVGIRGHYYFLIDQPNGQWLDVTDPPAFFDQPVSARFRHGDGLVGPDDFKIAAQG